MRNAASRVLCAVIAGALTLCFTRADAAEVSGIYTNRGGKPLADHQLHFENHIAGDMYLTRTGTDGAFSTDLPPGTYDLRAERGLIVRPGIRVEDTNLNVGRVADGAPYDVRRPFERQGIAPSLVETEAPATAHLEKPGAPPARPAPAPAAASSPAVVPIE